MSVRLGCFLFLKRGIAHKAYPLYYYTCILNALLSFADDARERAAITARWGEALSANRTYRRGTEDKG